MTIAADHGATNVTEYAALSERLANENSLSGDWHAAEKYWKLASLWHRKLKNEPESKRCLISAAECFVMVGEGFLTGPRVSAGGASHWMARAVEALRRAGADQHRIDEVHRRLLELQKQSLGEMGPLDVNLEQIPGFLDAEKKSQEAVAAFMRGCNLWTAVGRMALINEPTSAAELRKQVEETSKEFIWDKVIVTTKADATGKVADIMDPVGSGKKSAEAVRQREYEHAVQSHWPIKVDWRIEPARRVVMSEHALRLSDLAFLVEYNPLIPPGHEGIVLRGLQAGFFGDWLVAMHLLVPQVEGMVRHVLQQQGVVTSTLNSDSIQEEKHLNTLLWMLEAEDAFGPDVLFDLRGILIERFGHNLRNQSAHAMIPTFGFYQHASVYLWWLILWLCWRGYRLGRAATSETPSPLTGSPAGS
jgi:hypothetical protein